MTINAASAVNPTPGPAEGGGVEAIVKVATNVIQISAGDLAKVLGNVADALPMPGIGGLFGFLGTSHTKNSEEAKSWESVRNYLDMQIKIESDKLEKNEVRLKLLQTAQSGVKMRYDNLKGNCVLIARDSVTGEQTDAALKKLGFIMNPETFAEDAAKLEIKVREWVITEWTADRDGLADSLKRDRAALEQEKREVAGVEAFALASLQGEPFDNSQSNENLKTFEAAISPSENGPKDLRGQYDLLVKHISDLKAGLQFEKPGSNQAARIEKALAVFDTLAIEAAHKGDFKAKPQTHFSSNPISLTEACTILLKVRAKSSEIVKTKGYENYMLFHAHAMDLEKKTEALKEREGGLQTLSWSITRLIREVAFLRLPQRTSEYASSNSNATHEPVVFGAAAHKGAEKLDAEAGKKGAARLPSPHEVAKVEGDREKIEVKAKDHDRPKL